MNTENNKPEVSSIEDQRLNRQIADLAWDLQPERDLWPEIESSIRTHKKNPQWFSNWAPMAMAASLILAVGAASLSFMSFQRADQMQEMQASMVEFQKSQVALIEQQHQLVRAQFLVMFEQGGDRLDPQFVTEIKGVLDTIDRASVEIKNAIKTQPFANDYPSMLARTYQRETNLLNQISKKQTKSI